MKNLLGFMFFIFIDICLNAQIRFDHLTTKDGLSSNRIKFVFRDSKGYLWIDSEIGLDKYDSYKINTYSHNEKQPGTISNNEIRDIFEDHDKNIWIGTYDGLNLYCPESDSFRVFRNNPADINSIDHNRIHALFEDTKGNLWISTRGNCLNKWDPATKQFFRYPVKINSSYHFLREDSKGTLWLVSRGLPGIYRFDPETGNLTNCLDTSIDLSATSKKLYIDRDDIIWIMTYNEGLFSFDPYTGKFEQFNSNGDGKGTNGKIINDIIEEDDRYLWIGVDQGGINRFDKATRTFEYIINNDNIEDGLSNTGIWGMYKDNEGIVWISTSGGGINIHNPQKKRFKLFRHVLNNPNTVSSNIIGCFYEDSQGLLWIGTDNNGIDVFNRETGSFKNLKHNPANPFSISDNTIRCIGEDENNDLWIGTWEYGLNHFNRKTSKFTHYMPDATNPTSLSGTTVWHYTIDHKGIFWLAIHNIGVDLFDKNKGVIKRFVPDNNNPKSLSSTKVWYIYEDSNRNIWLCTDNGLNLYDSIHNSFIVYKHFPSQNIKVITEDDDKNLWLGTDNGICQIKADGTILQVFNQENGLRGKIVQGLVLDNSGNIWITTNNGMSKIDNKTKKINNFNEKEGLQDKAFFQGSFLKTRDGEIFFGGFNGFNSFFPDSIKMNPTIPKVYITEFQIFNKPVVWGAQDSPLKKSISETKEITLTHLQSVFSFGFTAINYTNPEKNMYAYKMEGFDPENSGWSYTDASRRYVTYTNLDPGEYTFRVKASNNDGVWNEKGTSIKIIILPPWWKTWWFRALVILVIVFSIYIFINYRILSLRKQKKLLSKMVKERTSQLEEANTFLVQKQEEISIKNEKLQTQKAILRVINSTLGEQKKEIESQKNELDKHRDNLEHLVKERTSELEAAMMKIEESDRLKSAFLQNMSHEIRTPLNAIVGFSNLLNQPNVADTTKSNYVAQINANTTSLCKLIDDILDLSLMESNLLSIDKNEFEINLLIDEVFLDASIQNPKSEIRISNQVEELHLNIITDRFRLKQILMNLINNACKFTESGFVEVGCYIKDKEFVLFVKDTGIGISSENLDVIFDRFRKVIDDKTKLFRGVGLGLSISKKIAELIDGKLTCESELGVGSLFSLSLPAAAVTTSKIAEPIQAKSNGLNLEHKTILIVEDEEMNFLYLESALQQTHAAIVWVQDGKMAVDLFLSAQKFDIVLMDIKMPILNGYDATLAIKKMFPNQIIVAQTAYARPKDYIEIKNAGFDDYLIKPIIPNDLYRVLNKFF